ncbi:cation diffusion facilitator family transporter [Pseudoxanthomonas wuyuanensis]|uniref:Cation diffusion facilitator family transporter n=1 Tax=Pseudoxanthomonas wuyuanensis TaxID=1073196 RepID=A0A286CV10_9GAMM|nr:cation diffusion facilitator family transporter [Pseudoxanthomonas wuyuanensis]KAF1717356.1 cation efflux family transporter [Pseudoxanthomonas wuyuanensis]SOD50241.1 cation diffusion facilitator family transporter [Pseudoxanthomonas wuyuanensis]
MAGGGDSTRAIFFALGANLAIAAAKGVAAFVTGSGAMLAETVHSLADCGNQLLLLLGLRQARRPASSEYPLGYGRAIYFWSFLVAVMLFSIVGMFSLYEGVHKLQRPEPLRQWGWAVGVLAFAIVAEGISMRACLQEVNKSRGGRSLWRWFRDSRQAELVVIFGEDLAALLGLLFALLAVVLSVITGNPLWDAIGTMAIGALLIVIAVLVAIEIKAMLIGQSVDPVLEQRLLDYLKARAEIEKLIHVITLQQGNEVVVSVQAVMRQREDVHALLLDINRVEDELKADFPVVRWTFFEPDLPRAQQVGRQGAPAA